MKERGVEYFVGAHCTGINSTYMIRDFMNAPKTKVLVGSVGTYVTQEGITPGIME